MGARVAGEGVLTSTRCFFPQPEQAVVTHISLVAPSAASRSADAMSSSEAAAASARRGRTCAGSLCKRSAVARGNAARATEAWSDAGLKRRERRDSNPRPPA
jgi:hypothetical protein